MTIEYLAQDNVNISLREYDNISLQYTVTDNTVEPTVNFVSWEPSGSNQRYTFIVKNNDETAAEIFDSFNTNDIKRRYR